MPLSLSRLMFSLHLLTVNTEKTRHFKKLFIFFFSFCFFFFFIFSVRESSIFLFFSFLFFSSLIDSFWFIQSFVYWHIYTHTHMHTYTYGITRWALNIFLHPFKFCFILWWFKNLFSCVCVLSLRGIFIFWRHCFFVIRARYLIL